MLLNVSGGLVGGDRLHTKIAIGPGAHVLLTTASASKAYRSQDNFASLRTQITISENATLEYLPDHLIPHNGAAIDQTLRIDLASGARAIVYDAFAAGRVGRGERWGFRSLISDVAITKNSVPLYLSRSRITPISQPLIQKGWMENANYFGAFLIVGDDDVNWSGLANDLHTALQKTEGLRGSASELSHGGCAARFMTLTAHGLKGAATTLWGLARQEILHLDAFPLRKS